MIQKTAALFLLCLLGFFSLAACSVFSPVKSESTTTYVINATPSPLLHKPTQALNLLVALPEADSIYNTPQMAYTVRPYEVAYFVKSRWAETPPQMLQPLIVKTLQNTHYFHSVGSAMLLGHYDFVLNSQLIQLQQDYSRYPYTVHLILRAQIINVNTNSLVATREFSVTEAIIQNTPYGGVIAANKATSRLLRQLAQFCLHKIN